jgi:hypothetical protein
MSSSGLPLFCTVTVTFSPIKRLSGGGKGYSVALATDVPAIHTESNIVTRGSARFMLDSQSYCLPSGRRPTHQIYKAVELPVLSTLVILTARKEKAIKMPINQYVTKILLRYISNC